MATLIETRKKIQAVTNSSKITKAMQLVAASKMRYFQKRAVSTRNYTLDLLNLLRANLTEGQKSIFCEKRSNGTTIFVLYTSDKGLCGALNNQLIKKLFKSEKWLNLKREDRLLITIGRKAYDFAKINKIPVYKHFKGISEKITILDALPIVDEIVSYWIKGKCKEVLFIAPHYKSTFTSYPILRTYLPFSEEMIESSKIDKDSAEKTKKKDPNYMIYEPNQERVLEILFEQIIQGSFIQSFFELKAAEYSSRMIAMQNATESANKIITTLKQDYNKTRQQVITQELAEILGGSEAIF